MASEAFKLLETKLQGQQEHIVKEKVNQARLAILYHTLKVGRGVQFVILCSISSGVFDHCIVHSVVQYHSCSV